MVKTRAFIAINLPDDIKGQLSSWIDKAKNNTLQSSHTGDNIKWVAPENFHITLHFLGYMDDNKLRNVKKILSHNIQKHKSVDVEINRFGCFPNESRPRVLFVDSHELNGNRLQNLQKSIGKELSRIGIKTDKRPWQMHITFARLKKPAPLPLARFKKFKPLKTKITSIDLMKSELYRTGPKYGLIHAFQL